MKVEESLNVTFDESPPTKLSPLVDDDVGEEEAVIKNTKVVNNNNEEEDKSIEVDEIVNIQESKNHLLDQVIGNINQRTLRMPPKRTSTSETPAITLDALRQLIADFTTALEAQVAAMANADNPNRNY
ncbi:hypothetical protein Tco_0011542 [Tanacetum coccineum]